MNGIVFDIKRFAIHDGPGIRTSIFFKGCPLGCWWCHNPESRKTGVEQLSFKYKGSNTIGWQTTPEELLKEVEKDRPFYEQSGGGVTFTGGEPLMQSPFLLETAKLFKKKKLNLCLDTTGYASQKTIQEISPFIDLFLFDLKHLNDEQHLKYTGVSNKPILENLEYLVKNGKNIQIRFPLIPFINDNQEHLESVSNYLSSLKHIKTLNILPYHKIANGKYDQLNLQNKMLNTHEPSKKNIEEVKLFFENQGFNVKIGG